MQKQEFIRRWEEDRETTYVQNQEFKFVTIHPFGDELQLIQNLKLRSIDCTYVGSYIQTNDLITFVEFGVCSEMISDKFKSGIYYQLNDNRLYSKLITDDKWLKKNLIDLWIKNMISLLVSCKSLEDFILKYNITSDYKSIS